jgi:predicted nucleic acid-binding Zn ribbon protein
MENNEHWQAWASGIYSGEGYATGNGTRSLRLGVANTNLELLTRFHEIVGVGRIIERSTRSRLGTKPQWEWQCDVRSDCHAVLLLLWPWLTGEKRAQAEKVIAGARSISHACATCAVAVPTRSGQKYCSTRCRNKARWQRDRAKEVVPNGL